MAERDELLHRTADIAADFLDRLPTRPVSRSVDLEKVRAALGGPLPDGPQDSLASAWAWWPSAPRACRPRA